MNPGCWLLAAAADAAAASAVCAGPSQAVAVRHCTTCCHLHRWLLVPKHANKSHPSRLAGEVVMLVVLLLLLLLLFLPGTMHSEQSRRMLFLSFHFHFYFYLVCFGSFLQLFYFILFFPRYFNCSFHLLCTKYVPTVPGQAQSTHVLRTYPGQVVFLPCPFSFWKKSPEAKVEATTGAGGQAGAGKSSDADPMPVAH